MPAPNLGLVGARGNQALYGELQQIVAERQFAQKLEEARAQAEFEREQKVREFNALEQYRATQTGLERDKYGLEREKFGADEAYRASTLPVELAHKRAQTFDIEVGRPLEAARAREHDIALAEKGDQNALARLQMQYGQNLSLEDLRYRHDLSRDAARFQREQGAGDPEETKKQQATQTILTTLSDNLEKLQTAPGLQSAVGWGGLASRGVGTLLGTGGEPLPGAGANYSARMKGFISALTTGNMPTMKGFGQMSDADRLMIQSAGTTLSAAQDPGAVKQELKRLEPALIDLMMLNGVKYKPPGPKKTINGVTYAVVGAPGEERAVELDKYGFAAARPSPPRVVYPSK